MRSMWPDLSAESSFTAFTLSLMAGGCGAAGWRWVCSAAAQRRGSPHAGGLPVTVGGLVEQATHAHALAGAWSGIGAQRSTSSPNGPQSPP